MLLLLLVGAFVLARSASGWLSPAHQAPLATLRGLLHAGAAQTLAAARVVRGLPGWL